VKTERRERQARFDADVHDLQPHAPAHHIIPQSRAITDLMTKLGIADMIHNPLFGQWINRLDHEALHAAGYNKEWEKFLNGLLKENPSPDQAAQKVIDFIKNELVPDVGIFAPY
jgi:hypothetical protein